jgi:hypothetical protein
MLSGHQTASVLAGWLREEPSGLAPQALEACSASLASQIGYHGLTALIIDKEPAELPQSLKASLREQAIAQTYWEAQHLRIASEVLQALDAAGVEPLVFKGTALAYSHYPAAHIRARGDTDILVKEDRYATACEVLSGLGLQTPLSAGGSVLTAETLFRAKKDPGNIHDIDLHRRLSNSAALSEVFSHKELLDRSVQLPRLGPNARRFSDVDSLLIACLHRKVHNYAPYFFDGKPHLDANRLIWLYDIKILSRSLSASDGELFWTLAKQKGLLSVCKEGLQATDQLLGRDARIWALGGSLEIGRSEAPARYLSSGAIPRLWMDLRATSGLARKLVFLRELLFPPPAYMSTLSLDRRPWLPWLYIKRIYQGILKHYRASAP